MRILLIDNYDSFTHNLYQLVGGFEGVEITVVRNDELDLDGVRQVDPDAIILSPGPGHPSNERDFGVCSPVITELSDSIPVLGVCLGHQGMALHQGGEVINAERILHGKTSIITHSGMGLFKDIPDNIEVARYHSLIVDPSKLENFRIEAQIPQTNEVMAIKHNVKPLFGVQFHPESFMTEYGKEMIANFLRIVREVGKPKKVIIAS